MGDERLPSFSAFWPYYVGEHRNPVCRGLHYLGTTVAMSLLVTVFVTGNPWWLLAGFAAGYGPAWVGHFFVEHNRPATFKYPLWSLASDFKMYGLAIRGKMAAEVARLYGSAAPAADAPLLVER